MPELSSKSRPHEAFKSGRRLDDRSFEEFRPGCESQSVEEILPQLAAHKTCDDLSSRCYAKSSICVDLHALIHSVIAVFDAGSHSKAAGSAYAELGGTKVMVAV